MGVRMVALSRTKSGLWAARKVIPEDVREAYGKREEKRSWPATLSLAEAKSAYASWLADIEANIEYLRRRASGESVKLTHRQVFALASEWFSAAVARYEADPGDRLGWEASLNDLEPEDTPQSYRAYERGTVDPDEPVCWRRQAFLVSEVDELLLSNGIVVDQSTREALIQQLHEAHWHVCRLMLRRCDGDYGPDPETAAFSRAHYAPPQEGIQDALGTLPMGNIRSVPTASKTSKVSLFDLYEGYVAERQPAAATQKAFKRQLTSLVDYLGHDDASRMTAADLVAWKDHLLSPRPDGTRRSPRTVKDTYLAAVRAVLAWGVDNHRLPINAASGIRVRAPKKPRLRDPGFTEAEAQTILSATLAPPTGNISTEHARARRWVPWLCAYSGARVNEITQLRAEDVYQDSCVWVFRITPEAGSVKTHEARIVPIHSHLIDQGFLKVVRDIASGPLFYDPRRGRGGSNQSPHSKKTGERLAAWVRAVGVTDPSVQPNHAWRHRFKTVGREAGMDHEARDRIQGHAPSSEGQAYGVWSAKALSKELEKLPRIEARSKQG